MSTKKVTSPQRFKVTIEDLNNNTQEVISCSGFLFVFKTETQDNGLFQVGTSHVGSYIEMTRMYLYLAVSIRNAVFADEK